MSAIDEAIKFAGGKTALARHINVTPQVVDNWSRRARTGGRVPAEYVPDIEKAVAGKVRAEELRPDVNWAYLRGTAIQPEAA